MIGVALDAQTVFRLAGLLSSGSFTVQYTYYPLNPIGGKQYVSNFTIGPWEIVHRNKRKIFLEASFLAMHRALGSSEQPQRLVQPLPSHVSTWREVIELVGDVRCVRGSASLVERPPPLSLLERPSLYGWCHRRPVGVCSYGRGSTYLAMITKLSSLEEPYGMPHATTDLEINHWNLCQTRKPISQVSNELYRKIILVLRSTLDSDLLGRSSV